MIHHRNCGMEFFTGETIRDLLSRSLETAVLGPDGFEDLGRGPGSDAAQDIDWLTIEDLDHHVETGKLREVPEASTIGAPR